MTVYPCCKINKDVVIMGSNIVSLTAYFEWSESVGYNGNRTQCWDCWCKRSDKQRYDKQIKGVTTRRDDR